MDARTELLFAVAAEIEGTGLRDRLGQRPDGGVELLVAGVGAASAEELQRRLRDAVPVSLISPGLAGALDPALRPGDVVLIDRWVSPEPPHDTLAEADAELRARIAAALHGARLRHITGAAVTVDAPLHDADRRTELFEAGGARVVEMEGRRWAAVAAVERVPFASVRVISDDAATPLPLPRHLLFERSGRIRWDRWLRALARDGVPDDAGQQLERLFRARHEWRRAMAALDAVAAALVDDLAG